jgi:hypothetical protein
MSTSQASYDLIRHALELVASDVEVTAAAQQIAAEAEPAAVDAAVEKLFIGMSRNPIIDIAGIRAARILLSASQVAA